MGFQGNVLFPSLLPAVLTGSLVFSMGESEPTNMVTGFSTITLPLPCQSLREDFRAPSAVASVLLCVTLLALLGLTWSRRR